MIPARPPQGNLGSPPPSESPAALADPDEILGTVRTVLTWDLNSPDLPATDVTLGMLDQLTSHGRTLATDLGHLYLALPPDSEAVHTAKAALGEASRRLRLRLTAQARTQHAAQRAQNTARLVRALLRATEAARQELARPRR